MTPTLFARIIRASAYHRLNLCSRAVNSQRLIYSQKIWCEMLVLNLSGVKNILLETVKKVLVFEA